MVTMLAAFGVKKVVQANLQVNWVGSSMGGLMGMMLAARADSPIEKLVVVDVGPFVPKQALDSIKSYVWKTPVFDSLAELKDHLKQVYPVLALSLPRV